MSPHHALREAVLEAWKKGSKERTVTITGTSMWPFIRKGYTVTLQPLAGSTPVRSGDIAVFARGSVLVAHRIIATLSTPDGVCFREKGDNNFYSGTIPANAVIGKIIRIDTGRHVIDLTRRRWIAVNRLLGFYWRCLFVLLDACMKLRAAVLPDSQLAGIGSVYRTIVRYLAKLPTIFFRYR